MKQLISKDKQAYHVVLTTHNSRTSPRMIKYNVKKGPPIELGLEEEIALTEIIGNIITENAYSCLEYNICKDHVHLLVVCEYEELSKMIQKLKSISSKLFRRLDISMGHDPLEHKGLWSQKFYRADLDVWKLASLSNQPGYIYKDSHFDNTIPYIRNNRIKHKLPKSIKLEKIINSFTVSQEIAFSNGS